MKHDRLVALCENLIARVKANGAVQVSDFVELVEHVLTVSDGPDPFDEQSEAKWRTS